jgi:drug/metabolite transporter (DMT)-like permease
VRVKLNKKISAWPYVLLVLTVLFWSGNFILGRGVRSLIPPVSLNFWRWAGALLILLPFGWPRVRRQRTLLRRHWRMLVLMSIPSITIFNTFIYLALQSTTAVNTALINAMMPIMIVLIGWVVFGERLVVRQLIGVIISFGA